MPKKQRQRGWLYLEDLSPEGQDLLSAMFGETILFLESAGRLGTVLFQFPPWFTARHDNLHCIVSCKERFPQYSLAIEFRNDLWLGEEGRAQTLDFLRANGLALGCVDQP